MYEKTRILALGGLIFLCLGVYAEGIHFEKLSLDQALAKAEKEQKLVFIDVFATWCGPCKYLSNEVFVESELGDYINENFISIKIDGEAGEGPQLMYDYGLDAFPTMLMLSPDKELRKKIVGAVSANTILTKADEAVHPEKTKIYQLSKQYESGDRTKKLLGEYLVELKKEGMDYSGMVEEYFESFPDLNLKEASDFIVFAEKIYDLENDLTKKFLTEIEQLHQIHEALAEDKLTSMLTGIVYEAVTSEDKARITKGLDILYDPYVTVFGEYAFDREKLEAAMMQSYDENVN